MSDVEEMTFGDLKIKEEQMRTYGVDEMIKAFQLYDIYEHFIAIGDFDRARAIQYWLVDHGVLSACNRKK